MTTDLEKIVLDGIDFNDEEKLSMESLTFTPAQAKAKMVENSNADGVVLVEEPHFTPAYFEMLVRVVPVETTQEALAVVGEVIDALTSCARTEEGNSVEWTPNETEDTYTAYAILGELLEMPITPDGELAGWFVESPVLKIKLTCRPFLYKDERVVFSATTSESQFQLAYIPGVEGDVPAECRAVLVDKASKKRRYAEIGQDVVETESNPALRIKATELEISGYNSALTTLAESVSSEVVRSKVVKIPSALCKTKALAHVGSFRAKLRIWAELEGLVRISYQTGEGTTTTLDWQEVPQTGKLFELDMGEILIEEAERGEQITKITIEGQATGTSFFYGSAGYFYFDTLVLVPTKRYAVARSPVFEDPAISGYDDFGNGSGSLGTREARIGGNWAGAGDADDFKLTEESGGYLYRQAVSDAANVPRYAILGTKKYTNCRVSCEMSNSNPGGSGSAVQGSMAVMARYVDTNNFVRFWLYPSLDYGYTGITFTVAWSVKVEKRVAGTISTVNYFLNGITNTLVAYQAYNAKLPWIKLELIILETGEWRAKVNGQYGVAERTGTDTDMATGGALAEGKAGLQDYQPNATASTRYYDNFEATPYNLGAVCNSGKALDLDNNTADFEDPTGKFFSPVPEYRGSDLYLDPAGDEELVNRLLVKMRRNDIRLEPDIGITDKQTLEVLARERFLAPR